jgi:tetratricopeptide (TPR) repeat protein
VSDHELAARIRAIFRGGGENERQAFRLAVAAVAERPTSPPLLCLLGDLNQLVEDDRYELEDSLGFYERAAAADPTFAEAWESIGYFHDVISGDYPTALDAFQHAVELGGGADSYAGMRESWPNSDTIGNGFLRCWTTVRTRKPIECSRSTAISKSASIAVTPGPANNRPAISFLDL